MLSEINSPADIKKFSKKEIKLLTEEIRQKIIEVVKVNGGHLASNLGIVELTIALHRVFNSPEDAIIFDVSHQCYTHKLLTGRYQQFNSLRQKDGITGFTNSSESEHDFFINGHASTSISSAIGLLTARQIQGEKGKVIAIIGDGALTGGMAFEALCHTGQLAKNLIVILNDNQMSIDHNDGAISRYLSRLTATPGYQRTRDNLSKIKNILPFRGKHLSKFVYRLKRSIKGMFFTNNLFTDLGFEYVGPLDGHNEASLERVLYKVKDLERPVVVHVVTKKGKGYEPAETNPELFHGVSPAADKSNTPRNVTFTEAFSKIITDRGFENTKLTAITAAMAQGTGLSAFAKKFPDRFFDVGIAEEHAVTFGAGLAKGGMIPVICIYSTFIQRSIDQIIHDISLQKLHCILMLDRAGAVPGDGVTHQGIFDIPLLLPVPEIEIMSPATFVDLQKCFIYAEKNSKTVVIRYPKLICPDSIEAFEEEVIPGRGILIKSEEKNKTLVVCTGGIISEVLTARKLTEEQKSSFDIYSLRFIKPFDFDYFEQLAKNYEKVVFIEEGIITGGISQQIEIQLKEKLPVKTKILGFKEKYYDQGSRQQILQAAELDSESIAKAVLE